MSRILSGTRPTGPLHIGNYLGAIQNWVENQSDDSYYMIADWHVLTTDYESHISIKENVSKVALDLLSVGIDPEKCTLFIQSKVPAHAELALIFSMITPIAWLERNPTFKDQLKELKGKDLNTHGFLGYPVLQASDILLYDADAVPVGEDQLPHIELTREIARRFNHIFGETFKEPKSMLTKSPKLLGTDGRKMSKSYNNFISLSDSAESVNKKLKTMMTDPARIKRTDPGDPEKCPVFDYHKILKTDGLDEIIGGCKTAEIGCVDCKKRLASSYEIFMEPIREKRAYYESRHSEVNEILEEGCKLAKQVSSEKLNIVREKVKI